MEPETRPTKIPAGRAKDVADIIFEHAPKLLYVCRDELVEALSKEEFGEPYVAAIESIQFDFDYGRFRGPRETLFEAMYPGRREDMMFYLPNLDRALAKITSAADAQLLGVVYEAFTRGWRAFFNDEYETTEYLRSLLDDMLFTAKELANEAGAHRYGSARATYDLVRSLCSKFP